VFAFACYSGLWQEFELFVLPAPHPFSDEPENEDMFQERLGTTKT